MDLMNENEYKEIVELIFEMTNKRYKNISEEKLLQLQELCGKSQTLFERVYTLLLECLKKPHSEIRFNTFYIFNKLFKMFGSFRIIAVNDMKSILDLCTDVNPDSKLPPPYLAARELKRFFLISLKSWMDEFGVRYKKLQLMYEYLQRRKHVDFVTLEMEDLASRRRREEERLKKERFQTEKLKSLQKEINDEMLEINHARESLETCIRMLIPTPEEFFINETPSNYCIADTSQVEETTHVDATDDGRASDIDMNLAAYRETGMIKGNFSVNIRIPTIQRIVTINENEENSVIIENAKDQFKLLNRKLERIKSWIKNLTALSGSAKDLKIVIDIKYEVENIIRRYQSIIFKKPDPPTTEKCDSDEDEMEEVISEDPPVDDVLIARLKDEYDQQPSTSGYVHDAGPSEPNQEERKRKLLEVAPKLPFDIDLYHWEEENLPTPMLQPVTAEGRNFWLATAADDTTEGIPVPDGAASLRTRTIEFVGKFEPVKWRCRFPLSSGKLCPRQDRYKCPFHGRIVARDETGRCVDAENSKKDDELLWKLKYNEIQDPQLLAQIKMETGIDLKISKKGKRKKVNDSDLTDIKKEQNTVYTRLKKKLFKRGTVKKVARTLDKLDQKRFTDKFGDQFQYVHETTTD